MLLFFVFCFCNGCDVGGRNDRWTTKGEDEEEEEEEPDAEELEAMLEGDGEDSDDDDQVRARGTSRRTVLWPFWGQPLNGNHCY